MKKATQILTLLLTLALFSAALVVPTAAKGNPALLSHGVQVLSSQTDVALWAPAGNGVCFSKDTFLRGMNRKKFDTLTVCTLPSPSDGRLTMGDSAVAAGQQIRAEDLAHLVFSPARQEPMEASFVFSMENDPLRFVCRVFLLESPNQTPTLSMVPVLSLQNFTYQNQPAMGTVSAYDPDGDSPIFEVVQYPEKGSLSMNGVTGAYVYTPEKGYTGEDGFTYVARDRFGNYSASATVSLRVELSGTSVTYADMDGSPAHNAALALTQAGVMSGTQLGTLHYFYPEKEVSRLDFLVMAMHAVGITDLPDCKDTGFADDGAIPEDLKGYVATAYAMKYISGSISEGKLCFLPDDSISRAEACLILSAIVGMEDVAITPTFADGNEIPAWARESIYSLHAVGILTADEGYISPKDPLTREQAAMVLLATAAYLK